MKQFLNFYQKGIKPTFRNFFTIILGYIVLFGELIIFFGVQPDFLKDYKLWALGITSLFIISSFIYYYYKSQFIVLFTQKPRDPSIDIDENLTYRDIEFSIYNLTNQIVDENPKFLVHDRHGKFDVGKNIIIGIDRGGAIVGGTLGKILDLPVVALAINWSPPVVNGIKTSIDTIDFSKVERIILVDDAIRNGNTMKKAINILETKIKNNKPETQYRKVCILYEKQWVKHKRDKSNKKEEIEAIIPDFFVYPTKHGLIQMPWDLPQEPQQKDYRYLLEKYESEFRELYDKSKSTYEEVKKLQQSN